MKLFGSSRHVLPKQFNYIPQYYDERKERLDNLLEESKDEEANIAAMKARVKMSYSSRPYYYDKNQSVSKARKKSNIRILMIFLVLILLAVMGLGKYSSVIFELAK